MPTPVVPYQIPDWANPANASVLDSWAQKAIRTLGGLAGVADPVSQVMGLAAAPIDVPTANLAEGLGAKTLKAYHGSPHDFDQFSLAKVGTGEGGQAYGHGLYFAENPQTAAAYKQQLSTGKVTLYGQDYPVPAWRGDMDPHTRLVRRLADARQNLPNGTDAEVVDAARQSIRDSLQGPYGDRDALKRELSLLKHAEAHPSGIQTSVGGKTYEVNLHASPDELLDWDKPLSQQQHMVEKLKQAGLITGEKPMGDGGTALIGPNGVLIPPTVDGGTLYTRLVEESGGRSGHTEGIASQKLKDAGIKGIQYLDQGSRAAGEGTKNFVIFDDKIIEIAKKYGVALPVAAEIFRRQQIGAKNGNVESSAAP